MKFKRLIATTLLLSLSFQTLTAVAVSEEMGKNEKLKMDILSQVHSTVNEAYDLTEIPTLPTEATPPEGLTETPSSEPTPPEDETLLEETHIEEHDSQDTTRSSTEYTDGDSYTVENGEATIEDVDRDISGDITIPSMLGGYPVTSIGSSAFNGCDGLTSITIPNSVTDIGERAFANCDNLSSITLGNNVEYIGDEFINGTKISSLFVPKSLASMSKSLEDNLKLKTVVFEEGTKQIGHNVFTDSSVENAFIPPSVEYIYTSALSGRAENFTIYCVENSFAHQFAHNAKMQYVLGDFDFTRPVKDVQYGKIIQDLDSAE